MKLTKKALGLFSAMFISILAVFPAAAAEAIESVELEVTSYIRAGDSSSNVSVRSLSSSCTVSDTSVQNEPDDGWEEGDTPKLKITLKADGDDYKFTSSLSKSDIKIRGNDATVTKVTRSSNTKFYVYVTLDELDDSGKINNGTAGNNNKINNNDYYVDPSDRKDVHVETTRKQEWEKDSGGWRYYDNKGNIIKDQWKQIDNKWYYFDKDGYMVTGWKEIDGKWYYMDESGQMLHDTTTPDGYRVGSDGARR